MTKFKRLQQEDRPWNPRVGRVLGALIIGIITSIVGGLLVTIWLPDQEPVAVLVEPPREPANEPTASSEVRVDKPTEPAGGEDNSRRPPGGATVPADPVVEEPLSPKEVKSKPYSGTGLAAIDKDGRADYLATSMLRQAGISHRVLGVSPRLVRGIFAGDDVPWSDALPTRLLLVQTEVDVETAGRGRYRAEATLTALLVTYGEGRSSFFASAFGAGFSENEARQNAKQKAVENLSTSLTEVDL